MRDKMKNVSLRTKLIVACTAMVLIPLVLTLLSFCLLRLYMTHRMGSQAALIFAEQKISRTFFFDMFMAIVLIMFFPFICSRDCCTNGLSDRLMNSVLP